LPNTIAQVVLVGDYDAYSTNTLIHVLES